MTEKRASLLQHIHRFCRAFDAGSLAEIMELFAEDGGYIGFDGKIYKGKTAIEKAFIPFFRGDFGKAQFHISELIVDEAVSKAMLRWTCIHDTKEPKKIPPIPRLKRLLHRTLYGKRFGWEGVDIFHFSPDGLVQLKATYTRTKIPISLSKPVPPKSPQEFAELNGDSHDKL